MSNLAPPPARRVASLKGPYALLIVVVVLGAVGGAIYLALKDAIAMRGRAAPLTAPSVIDAAARAKQPAAPAGGTAVQKP